MKKILAVDDNKNNLYFLKTLLEASGYQVFLANEGTQALDTLSVQKIDLIISDILMPVMDGFLLCHECHKNENYKDIPFVFYTATYTEKMDEELAQKLGAVHFIRKPIEPDELLKIIDNVIKESKTITIKDEEFEVEEEEILKLYSESLINKLEEKNLALIKEIAERKKTEAALILSEKSFKAIFENAAVGVAQIDSQTYNYIKVNQKYCNITGYTAQELDQLTFEEITHPDDLEFDIENMNRLKRGEIREYSMEKRFFRKNDEIVWVKLAVSPMWNSGEKPTTHIATIHDITERKQVEQELRESEKHLRTVLENEPECVKILGFYGEVIEMNPAGLAMIEADSLEQIRGKQVLQIVAPEYREAFAKLTKNVLQGATKSLEFKIIGLKGAHRWLETKATPMRNEEGEVVSLLGVTRDITERKISEKEIIFQAHLLNTVKQAVIATDTNGTIVFWNRFAETLYGWKVKEAVGQKIFKLVAPELSDKITRKIASRLSRGKSWEGEYSVLRKSGERFSVQVSNSPIKDKNDNLIGFVGIAFDITERKNAEMALQESEERLRMLFEQMIDGFYYSTSDGKLIDINPAMVKMFGYSSKEEMLKVDIVKDLYFSPEDRISYGLQQGVGRTEIYPMRRKDGSVIWVEDNGRYIYDDEGIIRFHEGVLRDVTERKLAEEKLQQINERLELSQQAAKIGSFEWDIRKDEVYWSPVMESLYGLEPGEFARNYQGWKKYVHPEDIAEVDKKEKEAYETGEYSVRFRVVLPNKKYRWIRAKAKVFYDEDNNPIQIVGVNMDVTERVEAEKAIAEANLRAIREYENLLDVLSELAKTVGAARNINSIFNAVDKFTCKSIPCGFLSISVNEDENGQKPIYFCLENQERNFSEPNHFQIMDDFIQKAFATSEIVVVNDLTDINASSTDKLTQYFKSALVVPMKMKGDVIGVIVVKSFKKDAYANEHCTAMRMAANVVANAIENVRLLELEQQREEQLLRAQKLESVGRLAGGIAHDFNNMLTAINGYSELALNRLGNDDPIRNNILEIKKAGDRSAELTHQLLAFSRQQVLQLKVLNLNDIITDTMTLVKRLIGEDLKINVNLADDLGLIKADQGQLSQVIINLAVNARDAMPNGGLLEIETSNTYISDDFAESHAVTSPGSYVLLTVRDTGEGMDKETLKNIFEPFFTTKVVGKGTGLGLATVYGVVKQLKGHIFVESEVNAGATFSIYIPLIDKEILQPKIENKSNQIQKGSETILIVEDEKMVRDLTRQVLEACGYKIVEASNGVEALAIFENQSFDIDLVLTDIVMPQMGGSELGKRISKMFPNLPIIFTSGYTDDPDLSDYFIKNEANYIAKPFTFEELSIKVRKMLDLNKKK